MNRTYLLIAVAALALAGLGLGLLLPALNVGPLAGSIAPTTAEPPLVDIIVTFTPTPTPVEPVVITITGSYEPYRKWRDNVQMWEWFWRLESQASYDATGLPAGVTLRRLDYSLTATDENGQASELDRIWYDVDEPPVPMVVDGGAAPGSATGGLPVIDTYTLDDSDTTIGCAYNSVDLCAPSQMWFRPPFNASFTTRASDGTRYTKTVTLPPASWAGYGF